MTVRFYSHVSTYFAQPNNGRVDTYLGEDASVASLVQITGVWPSTVGIDLVDGHRDLAASLDLRDSIRGNGIFGVFSDVDVS